MTPRAGLWADVRAFPPWLRRSWPGLSILAAMLTWPIAVAAAFPPATITISPGSPTASDVIQVTVNTNSLCYPTLPTDGLSVGIVGNTVEAVLKAQCPGIIGVPPPPYVVSFAVGPLPTGLYRVTYSISAGTGPNYQPPELTGMLDFAVGNPAIPVLERPLTVVLVVVLGVVGGLMIRRRSMLMFTTFAAAVAAAS